MKTQLKAPFPWFGGKSRVAHIVWKRFGDCYNYVEPFFGSGAVLLNRPHEPRIETVNDKDCYLANFWRALQADPDEVAQWADNPVNEADLHARHTWLVNRDEFREKMKSDPDYFDAKIAGWWVWGICCWIGGEWCRIKTASPERKRILLKRGGGVGVHAQRVWNGRQPQLKGFRGVNSVEFTRPALGALNGIHNVEMRRPRLGPGSIGTSSPESRRENGIYEYFQSLRDRLRRVRVCCGDWKRVLGYTPTASLGLTGIFLDPPYSREAGRDKIYSEDDMDVAHEVRQWALENGDNPRLRIALCGYENEHSHLMPANWECIAWKAPGGYGAQANGRGRDNCLKERIWFSPHCLRPQDTLFANLGLVETVDVVDTSL